MLRGENGVTALDDFECFTFEHEARYYPVYRKGQGPGVLIIHEVPGITPPVAAFARRVAAEGFTVFMPSLFGTPGKAFSSSYAAEQLGKVCVSREFAVLARHESSPITDYLRALCRAMHAELGGVGVGVVGMCLTGNFGLALLAEPSVIAPVLSQPSLPSPVTARHRCALHLTRHEAQTAVQRTQEEGVQILGLRFTHDPLCPADRFQALRETFGRAFEGIEIDSSPGNAHGIPRTAHSVLTLDLVDEAGHPTRAALLRVLAFLRQHLQPLSPA